MIVLIKPATLLSHQSLECDRTKISKHIAEIKVKNLFKIFMIHYRILVVKLILAFENQNVCAMAAMNITIPVTKKLMHSVSVFWCANCSSSIARAYS